MKRTTNLYSVKIYNVPRVDEAPAPAQGLHYKSNTQTYSTHSPSSYQGSFIQLTYNFLLALNTTVCYNTLKHFGD